MPIQTCLLVFASLLLLRPAPAAPNPPPVRVMHVTWHGWKGAVEISNGIVEAIVVPQIGRIMAFERVGQPQTNPLYENPDFRRPAALKPQKPGDWANYGGDKVWPAPQSDWPRYIGRQWPPDPAFDGRPEAALLLPSGVRLLSPTSAAFGLRAERTLTMRPGEPRLYLTQSLVRLTPGAAPALPLSVWAITQIQGDGLFVVPLPAENTASKFPVGYQPLMGPMPAPPFWRTVTVEGQRLLLARRDPKDSHRVATKARDGWLAHVSDSGVLFIERTQIAPHGTYPDDDSPSEVYSNSGATSYLEMEMLGPLTQVLPKTASRVTTSIVWQLTVLPSPPADDTEAARQALQAAQKPKP